MKALKWGLLVAAIVLLPFVLVKKGRVDATLDEENIRYDVDDYVADQSL